VLAAQLEQSKLLGELSTETENEAEAQAALRSLLGRGPLSPPVLPVPLRLTAAPAAPSLARAPAEAVAAAATRTADASVVLARKNFKPDFQVQYMYQNTGPAFPDYYQWTVGLNLPIHAKSRLKPELERAAQLKLAAQEDQRSQRQQDEGALATLQARLDNDARLLRLDNDALLPQVRATAAARLAAYGAGRANIVGLLETERDLLAVQQQYWQTVADHEKALAQLGALTGVTYE
jgi:outer membrane protein TolC